MWSSTSNASHHSWHALCPCSSKYHVETSDRANDVPSWPKMKREPSNPMAIPRRSLAEEAARAKLLCMDAVPNAAELAKDPELPRLRREWRAGVRLIVLNFDLRKYARDLNWDLGTASSMYWDHRLRCALKEKGTGPSRKARDASRHAKALCRLLNDAKLRNRLESAARDADRSATRVTLNDTMTIAQRIHAYASSERSTRFQDIFKGLDTLQGDIRDLDRLATIAVEVKAEKPKGHRGSYRAAAIALRYFWVEILGRSGGLRSGQGLSQYVKFVSRCLSLICGEQVSADVAYRALLQTNFGRIAKRRK